MPDLFTLRAWAIDTGNGALLEDRHVHPRWCPVVMYSKPLGANKALQRLRQTHPDASVVRVRVTIDVLHKEVVTASALSAI
jgi:hypothetical protein